MLCHVNASISLDFRGSHFLVTPQKPNRTVVRTSSNSDRKTLGQTRPWYGTVKGLIDVPERFMYTSKWQVLSILVKTIVA